MEWVASLFQVRKGRTVPPNRICFELPAEAVTFS